MIGDAIGNGTPIDEYPVRYPAGTAGAPTSPGAVKVIPYGWPAYPGQLDGLGKGTNELARVVRGAGPASPSGMARARLRRRVARFGAGGAKALADCTVPGAAMRGKHRRAARDSKSWARLCKGESSKLTVTRRPLRLQSLLMTL